MSLSRLGKLLTKKGIQPNKNGRDLNKNCRIGRKDCQRLWLSWRNGRMRLSELKRSSRNWLPIRFVLIAVPLEMCISAMHAAQSCDRFGRFQ
jgi:hypothetical protein